VLFLLSRLLFLSSWGRGGCYRADGIGLASRVSVRPRPSEHQATYLPIRGIDPITPSTIENLAGFLSYTSELVDQKN
jgi:hypothetical protein